GLRPDLPVLLVTGGSQGARSLNLAVLDAADWIRGAGIQVLHILGPRSGLQVDMPAAGPPYITLPYLDRMDLAYAAADFALCRSGAMTCAELTAVGLPAADVPLPHGNGEQRLDALPIVRAGRGLRGSGGGGGSGMARSMIARGVTGSGSDSAGGELLASRAALGADVDVGHAAANLADADTVVVSSAIRPDNPELAAARARGLRVLHR